MNRTGRSGDGDGDRPFPMSTFDGIDGSSGASLELAVRSAPEEIAGVRHAVADFLRQRGVSSSIVEDVQLVTSELVTNGVMHGESGPIGVAVDVSDSVTLVVSNVGPISPIPPVDAWALAPPAALTGRGLGIVRRLCDDVAVRDDHGRATVICRRRLPDGGAAT